jgi:hypothetical protein
MTRRLSYAWLGMLGLLVTVWAYTFPLPDFSTYATLPSRAHVADGLWDFDGEVWTFRPGSQLAPRRPAITEWQGTAGKAIGAGTALGLYGIETARQWLMRQEPTVIMGQAYEPGNLPRIAGGQPPDTIPAFPEARGWGAGTLATCRDKPLQVIQVTSLNESGAGTLREAIETKAHADSFTVIGFRVGGTIDKTGSAVIFFRANARCVYVAGQTAPGQGIEVRETSASSAVFRFASSASQVPNNVLMRYVRARHSGLPDTSEQTGISVHGGHHFYFDHVSMALGVDSWFEAVPLRSAISGVSVSNSLFCGQVSTGFEFQVNQVSLGQPPTNGMSANRNFMCHASHRMPRFAAGSGDSLATQYGHTNVEWANNLSYKAFGTRTGTTMNGSQVDYVGNLLRVFPPLDDDSQSYYYRWEWSSSCGLPMQPAASVYMDGNKNYSGTPRTDWELVRNHCDGTSTVPDSIRRLSPLAGPYWPLTLMDADALPDSLLPEVGVSRLLACDGTWRTTDIRDGLDEDFVQSWHDNDGPTAPNDQTDWGGYTSPSGGTACADADNDGMFDAWETLHSVDTPDSVLVSGYLTIEAFLSGFDPDDPEPWEVGAAEGTGTFFIATDSTVNVYRTLLILDTLVADADADTIIRRTVSRDTFPLGTVYDAHPDCVAGDTILLSTQDTIPNKTALTVTQINAYGTANGLSGCDADTLRERKVRGVASLDDYRELRHIERYAMRSEGWAA